MIVSIVTGASSGIGEAIYKRLKHWMWVENGKGEVLLGANKEEIIGISRRGPDMKIDLSAMGEAYDLPSHLADVLGTSNYKIRHLVNCAGMLNLDEEYPTREGWFNIVRDTMNLNFWAPYLASQRLLPKMIDGQSTITNISSISAIRPEYDLPVYSASKAGLTAMTRSLALALAPRKIRVNTIAPGFIRTDLVPGPTPQHLLDKIPLRREANVDAILPAFECILNSDYMTGAEIVVDGGLQWAK